jgi:hypothetical protein
MQNLQYYLLQQGIPLNDTTNIINALLFLTKNDVEKLKQLGNLSLNEFQAKCENVIQGRITIIFTRNALHSWWLLSKTSSATDHNVLRNSADQVQDMLKFHHDHHNTTSISFSNQDVMIITNCSQTIIKYLSNTTKSESDTDDSDMDDQMIKSTNSKCEIDYKLVVYITKIFCHLIIIDNIDTFSIAAKTLGSILRYALRWNILIRIHEILNEFPSILTIITSHLSDINNVNLHMIGLMNDLMALMIKQPEHIIDYVMKMNETGMLKCLGDFLTFPIPKREQSSEERVFWEHIRAKLHDEAFWSIEEFLSNNGLPLTSALEDGTTKYIPLSGDQPERVLNETKIIIAQYFVRDIVSMMMFATTHDNSRITLSSFPLSTTFTILDIMVQNGLLASYLSQAHVILDCDEDTFSELIEDEEIQQWSSDSYVPEDTSLIVYKIVETSLLARNHQKNITNHDGDNDQFSLQWLIEVGNIGFTIANMLGSMLDVDGYEWIARTVVRYEVIQARMVRCIALIMRNLGGLQSNAGIEFACQFVRQHDGKGVLTQVMSVLYRLKRYDGNGYAGNMDIIGQVNEEDKRLDGFTWKCVIDNTITPTKFLSTIPTIDGLLEKLDKCDDAWDRGGFDNEGFAVGDMNWILSMGVITCSILREFIEVEGQVQELIVKSSGKRVRLV